MPSFCVLAATFSVLFSCSALANPVFDLPEIELPADELFYLNEISQGTHQKFEFRTSTGEFFLDRTLCPRKVAGSERLVHDYPVHYGISPGRFNIDLDPLDLNVLGNGSHSLRRVRVIGMMQFDECEKVPCLEERQWKQDWKVLAVDILDPAYSDVKEASQLPTRDRLAIVDFFSNYKGPKKDESGKEHPQTRVTGFLGKKETLALIRKDFPLMSKAERAKEQQDCDSLFSKIASSVPQPKPNDFYLRCLQRVRNPLALRDSASFDFFLKYNAGMRLLDLGEASATLENAFALMQARKEKGKTYYRFVGHDRPAPGTGNAVFEWVETKNRNSGCPKGFPAQHYESRPLVDID